MAMTFHQFLKYFDGKVNLIDKKEFIAGSLPERLK